MSARSSQPSTIEPFALCQLGWQETSTAVPLTHAPVAFGIETTTPIAPQLFGSVITLVSHPFATLPSPLAKPLSQTTLSAPPTQWTVPLGTPYGGTSSMMPFRSLSTPSQTSCSGCSIGVLKHVPVD